MEELAGLLFTLASVDRLILISETATEKSRLNYLTAKLSATSQEVSNHLMRLHDAKVIEKDSDGYFGPTAFGRVRLRIIPCTI